MLTINQRSVPTDWTIHLKRTRSIRELLISNNDNHAHSERTCNEIFLNHVRSLREIIRQRLICSFTESTTEQNKEVRTCLRVALCCLSIPPNQHLALRRSIQQELYESWHDALFTIMVNKNIIEEQCRLLAAQVLCNTITDCPENSLRLMKHIPPEPSDVAIAQTLRDLHLTSIRSIISKPIPDIATVTEINWLDLILSSTTSRSLLAAVVACLHNCICSIAKAISDNNHSTTDHCVIYKIATSTLLISTLLRHIISTLSIQQQKVNPESQVADASTEWILLTISKLCRLGLLSEMYAAIGGGNNYTNARTAVYPEHVVLLHSVRNAMEEDSSRIDDMDSEIEGNYVDTTARCFNLGGEYALLHKENEQICTGIIDTHCFLANLYVTLSRDLTSTVQHDDIGSETLQASALQLVLDVLAESISDDSSMSNRIRIILGSETNILPTVVKALAVDLDRWFVTNESLCARDQAKMNEINQCRITTSVRVIGNLCFRCRQNQDALRTIEVPYIIRENRANLATKSVKPKRNGLHVLLSTTSMSYACFTLREWAVVAIRSALDDCLENQAIVLELESQAAVQTAEVEGMGIRVNLNVVEGTVSVDQLKSDDD